MYICKSLERDKSQIMTGFQVAEKKTQLPEEIPEKMTMEQPRRSKKSPLILAAVIACVVTTVIIGSVVASLYFGTHLCDSSRKTTERSKPTKTYLLQISDSPAAAKVEVHKPERVIITETSSTDKKLDHTITLQDYKRDLQAVLDQNRKECYVFPVFYDFDEALKLSEDNETSVPTEGETMELNMNRTLEAIPREVLQHAVGSHIADFCSDVPTYWLIHATSEDLARVKRRIRIRIGVSFKIFNIRVKITAEFNLR